MEFLPVWISVDRVRYVLSKLETIGALKREGIGKGTKYLVIKLMDDIELYIPHKTWSFPRKKRLGHSRKALKEPISREF